MSTGTKRLFWLLANVFISSCTNVSCIGIEELETSIHPKMMKNLLEILSEALEDTQLIISSHSPYLIQYLKTSQLFVGVPSNDGVAIFRKLAPSKVKQLISSARDYGMSFGEYLFELLSGDENSYNLVRKYLGGD
jgi:predicted ATPase